MKKKFIFGVIGCFLLILIIGCFRFSYSFLFSNFENKDALEINVIDFSYVITGNALTSQQFTIDSFSSKDLVLSIVASNALESRYEVYYQFITSLSTDESNLIFVEYLESSDATPTGTMQASQTKKISIRVTNRSSKTVTLQFGCQGGFTNRDFILESGYSILKEDKSLYSIISRQGVLDTIPSTYVVSSVGVDFTHISSDTNGKGVYLLHTTQNATYPIYYYRGDVQVNHVKFAGFCWKIVRTTETGGIKMIYNGMPDSSGACAVQTGVTTQIGTSRFNDDIDDNAYAGYMYGTIGSSTYQATHENLYDSSIKGIIDSWYKTKMTSYTSRLEDTVWCNDRSLYSGTGIGNDQTFYSPDDRLYNQKMPSLVCENNLDRFTVSTTTGNGSLTYPVSLLTADEMVYAGGLLDYDIGNSSFYLYTGQSYWSLSPDVGGYTSSFHIDENGSVVVSDVTYTFGVRPVISLKGGTQVASGIGTATEPYIIV